MIINFNTTVLEFLTNNNDYFFYIKLSQLLYSNLKFYVTLELVCWPLYGRYGHNMIIKHQCLIRKKIYAIYF